MAKPGHEHGSIALVKSPSVLAVAVLCVVTLVFYHGLWLPDLVLIKRDAYAIWLPLKQHMIERLATGELPQWFPYEALGRSFIGTAVTGIFHPFTALYFLLPAPDAYRASTLLSCLLAAVGAFALGRSLNFSHAGALVAGVAFTLSGYVVSFTEHLIYLYSICVLPLFCAALEKALTGNRAWAVAPAVVWATVLLHGDGQTGYYYAFVALLWMGMRAPKSYREAGIRLALIGGLAALLAGIQLGPAAATFMDSERAQPDRFREQALGWSTHPLRLLTVAASPVGEQLDPMDLGRLFFGSPPALPGLLTESLYLGIPVTGLALLGARYRRDLRVLVVLGGLALILALGHYGGLYEVLYRVVPLWSAFRYPEKFMGFFSFAAAMLAGAGLDTLRSEKNLWTPWLVAAVLCAGAWLGLRTEAAGAWTAASFGTPPIPARTVTTSAALAFLFSAVAALGMCLVSWGARGGSRHLHVLLIVPVAIIALDLSRANLGAYHTGPAGAASFTPPLVEALQAREGALRPGRFRFVSLRANYYSWVPKRVFNLLGHDAVTVASRQALDFEHNAQFRIESADYYLPGFNAVFASMNWDIGIAARYNVAYYVSRRFLLKEPRFVHALIAELPEYDLALFRNPAPAKPRAYLSPHPEYAIAPVDPATFFARPDFLSGDVDVIERSDTPLPGPAAGGSAVIERYAPEHVQVHVKAFQPAVLILLDAYDKGWTAALENGAEIPILRANVLVRAVVVPAGAHTVTFRYETPLLRAGAAASFAGTLICLGLMGHAWRQKRQPGAGS